MDCGFVYNTEIKLYDGSITNINKIIVNDILENGEKVYGIVELDGLTVVEQFKYNLGENEFIEGYVPNLTVSKEKIISKNKKLYHLLTNKKSFRINNLCIPDYNDAIDRFLETNKWKLLSINYV